MKIFYTCFFVVCINFIEAQTVHSKIPISHLSDESNKLALLTLERYDTLFIAAPSGKNAPTKAYWVLPSGKAVRINSPEVKNKLIVFFSSRGDSSYLYYLEQRNQETFLCSIVQGKQTGVVNKFDNSIYIPGKFVSVFSTGKADYLLSIVEDKNEIHIGEIEGMKKIKEIVVKSPFDLHTMDVHSSFSFISRNEIIPSAIAASPNKIYLQGNTLYVSMDRMAADSEKQGHTSIFKIDLETGKSEHGIISDNSGNDFSTYINNNHLFKMSKSRSRGAVISIYNLADFNLLQTMIITEKDAIAKNHSFKSDLSKTTDKESIWDAVSNNAMGFIHATSIDSTSFIIRVGSYHLITRSAAAFIPVVSSVPLLAIAGAVAKTLAYSTAEWESIDQYFYLSWDGKNTPTLANTTVSVAQTLDYYDVASFKQKKKITYRTHLEGSSGIFGIYREMYSPDVNIMIFENLNGHP